MTVVYDLTEWILVGMYGTVRHSFVSYGAIWIGVERKIYAGLYNLKKCELVIEGKSDY